jgi:protein subunit release factor B
MSTTLFTVTPADLREEHFRGSGNGGQKKQKTSSGVRFTHEPSGASAESEAQRSQTQNRREALRKLACHPKFTAWAKAQAAAIVEGHRSLERKIDSMMSEKNLKVELGVACTHGETVCDVVD